MPPWPCLIIDTDPGTDDALAILMALGSPSVKVVGLTTVGGNVPLARATRNALAVLEHVERADVPVAPGASRPLAGRYRHAYYHHGPGGLSARLASPKTPTWQGTALEFMCSTLLASDQPVTIVALGPPTNVARLLRQEPAAASKLAHVILMGGAVDGPGNVTPFAEFNFFNDPLAAQAVLSSGIPTTLVDLHACRQVTLGRDDILRPWGSGRRPSLARRILANWFQQDPTRESYVLCDPLAMAIAIQPDIATYEATPIEVTVEPGARWGQTIPGGVGRPLSLVRGVDTERFFSLFYSLLAQAAEQVAE